MLYVSTESMYNIHSLDLQWIGEDHSWRVLSRAAFLLRLLNLSAQYTHFWSLIFRQRCWYTYVCLNGTSLNVFHPAFCLLPLCDLVVASFGVSFIFRLLLVFTHVRHPQIRKIPGKQFFIYFMRNIYCALDTECRFLDMRRTCMFWRIVVWLKRSWEA